MNRHVGEGAVLFAEIEEIGIGKRVRDASWSFSPSIGHTDRGELLRLRERQRLEQNRIDHAEDGSVCADTERQRQRSNGCERRLFKEDSQRVSQVL